MGSGKGESSAKAPKPLVAQEPPPTSSSAAAAASVYPDWSNFQQAYPPVPPPGFFHSPVGSSPQAHPYMWGVQHLMPPYGSPPPPYLMYPPRGLYAHPSIPPGSYPFGPYATTTPNANAETSGAVLGGMEMDDKPSKGKKGGRLKRSGSSNNLSSKKSSEPSRVSGTPANELSQSGDSGSDNSSEDSDVNSQNDSQPKSTGHESSDALSQAQGMAIFPMPGASAPGVAGPATNLNIGMEYWAASSISPVPAIHGKMPVTTVGGAAALGGSSEHCLQDERERKRQRRKQSNREAARRSRMRKQAEFEELAHRAEALKEENTSLKVELDNIKSEYQQLLSQYNSLKEKLEVQQEIKTPDIERKE
ncbi:hypothetical protein Cni_G27789 [Canna indica]|uniref:BZIP domain-containing protein n=1 Tax=Canna indica TaxID=4628 RepID=A0AAQ3L8E9_9LILI|nr:hypothetical protein Cni_G27789 [Canna indica]